MRKARVAGWRWVKGGFSRDRWFFFKFGRDYLRIDATIFLFFSGARWGGGICGPVNRAPLKAKKMFLRVARSLDRSSL
jgi:hypothetical protein